MLQRVALFVCVLAGCQRSAPGETSAAGAPAMVPTATPAPGASNAAAPLPASAPRPTGAPASGEPKPRSPNLKVHNLITANFEQIVVEQTQTFEKDFVKVLFEAIDKDKDGALSDAEKQAAPGRVEPYYSGHTRLRFNWNWFTPDSVQAQVGELPARLPKDLAAVAPVTVRFTALYRYKPGTFSLLELVQPSLNAARVTAEIRLDENFRAFRATGGNFASGDRAVVDLVQENGVPDTFGLIYAKEIKVAKK